MPPRLGGKCQPDHRAHQLAVIRDLWLEGRTIKTIAERLGMSVSFVISQASRSGLPSKAALKNRLT